jgi:tetratricopeptide (TPR) repeat protein
MRKALVGAMIYILLATCSAWGQDAMYFYNLGLESSMVDKKINYFTRALELNPKLTVAYKKRGRLYYFQENYAKMMHDFQRFSNLEPYDPEGYKMVGLARLKMGDLDEAFTKFSRAIELDHQLASAYGYRAEVYLLKGFPEKAIQDATRTIKFGGTQPTIGRAYTIRSKAYRKLGLYGQADADFDKAYDLDPENYGYKYFTITNHLATFASDSDYITSENIRRLGLICIIVLLFGLIFKLALPAPNKGKDS